MYTVLVSYSYVTRTYVYKTINVLFIIRKVRTHTTYIYNIKGIMKTRLT